MKHTLNRSSVKNDYQKQIILRLAMIVLYFVMLFCIIVINNIYINTKNDMDAVKNLKLTQMKQNFDFRMDMALTSVENLKRTQEVVGLRARRRNYLSIAKIYTRLTENQNAYTQQSFLLALQKPYGDLVITPSGTMPAKDFCAQYDIASGSASKTCPPVMRFDACIGGRRRQSCRPAQRDRRAYSNTDYFLCYHG